MIAHAYAEWGADCLQRLNGDFAFAVWDREEEELFLARDRFGVRPLFLAEFGGDFSFASEAKALLRHPEARRELDPAGLVETFTAWSNLPERSAFAGHPRARAGALPARRPRGHPRGAALVGPRLHAARRRAASDEQLIEELRELLSDSTRIRLRADVPVAAYLSGGLDSSATATLARQHMTNTLYSFGLGFADERFDESAFQDRIVAGARHRPDARRDRRRATSPSCCRARSSCPRSRRCGPRSRRCCGSRRRSRTRASRSC